MIFDRAIKPLKNARSGTTIDFTDPGPWLTGREGTSRETAMKISAVNACVEIISNSISKLPMYVLDENTKRRVENHPLMRLLTVRPNEAMTPTVAKKLVECNRLLGGNGYQVIIRNPTSAAPVELIPVPYSCMQPFFDTSGKLWYLFTNPNTGEVRKLGQYDVLHYMAYSEDGIEGISVLHRAADVVKAATAAQRYETKFFTQGAQPVGVLTVDTELKGASKEKVRAEWERFHSGVDNAFRTAILDLGLKYQPISVSNKDAQFVENKAVTVEDIARFFGVPMYKLNAGKQAYNSNEQNSIEYVKGTIHPTVEQMQEEDSYKLLFNREIRKGLWIKRNMMAELKGDTNSRGSWYKTMREAGVFTVDEIRALEDMPSVEGGNTLYASLNYVPLDLFRELSLKRAGGGENN